MDVYQTVKESDTSQSPGFVAGYVKGELAKGGVKDVVGVYETRVRGRSVLLANPRKESRVGEARRAAKERRRVERTRGGVQKGGTLRGETCSYASVVGLHRMWCEQRGLSAGLEGALIRGEIGVSGPSQTSTHFLSRVQSQSISRRTEWDRRTRDPTRAPDRDYPR